MRLIPHFYSWSFNVHTNVGQPPLAKADPPDIPLNDIPDRPVQSSPNCKDVPDLPTPPSKTAVPDSAVCATCLKGSSELGVNLKPCNACGTELYCSKKCRKAGRADHLEACMAIRPVKDVTEEGLENEAEYNDEKVEEKKKNKKKKPKSKKKKKNSGKAKGLPKVKKPLIPITLPPNIHPSHQYQIDELVSQINNLEIREAKNQASFGPLPEGYGYSNSIETTMLIHYKHQLNLVAIAAIQHSDPSKDPLQLLSSDYPPRTYLSSLPEVEAMKHLIDSFRLRVEDEYTFNMEAVGLYAGVGNATGWKKFLRLADKKEVLPTSWDDKARQRLNKLIRDERGGHFLDHALEAEDLIRDYEDPFMAEKLRSLSEKIYGTPVTGGSDNEDEDEDDEDWDEDEDEYSDDPDFGYDSI